MFQIMTCAAATTRHARQARLVRTARHVESAACEAAIDCKK
jgi:hypothetical protein